MKRNQDFDRELGERLRSERPEASSRLVASIAKRLGGVPVYARRPYRLAVAGALTAVMLVALASVGGIGYAANQVTHAATVVKHTVLVQKGKPKPKPTAPTSRGSAVDEYGFAVNHAEPTKTCPGKTISISGKGFTGVTGVTIGGAPASFTVVSEKKIKAVVPAGAVSGGSIGVHTSTSHGSAPEKWTLKSHCK